jgi:hypothetical protein
VTKRLTINAAPVIVAWLIIFLHGAIPHDHHQEHDNGCKSLIHWCHDSELAHASGIFNKDAGSSEHHLICHFNTGPFHSLDNEIVFYTEPPVKAYSVEPTVLTNHNGSSLTYLSRLISLPDNLRAPPHFMG